MSESSRNVASPKRRSLRLSPAGALSPSSCHEDADTPRSTQSLVERVFANPPDLVAVPHTPSARFEFSTLWRYVGPGLLTSVAFVDPGNIESDLQAGAYAGYRLMWVVGLSTTMGFYFQSLAMRLGTATGKDLATHCAEQFGGRRVQLLWLMTQIAIIGSDIQEIVGSAVAFRLLFGIPLWAGCLFTALDTFTFLGLHATGLRRLEALFGALILTMVICFFANFFLTKPEPMQILEGLLIPSVTEHNAIQAASILGAVIMPHNIFLHSALVLSRDVDRSQPAQIREANFYFTIEIALALFVAFLINGAIVSVFAHGFFSSSCEAVSKSLGLHGDIVDRVFPPFACVPVGQGVPTTTDSCYTGLGSKGTCQPIGLQVAGKPLEALLGTSASTLWAIGLLAAGQSSTVTGTYAGQFVMEGMLNLDLPNWKRVAFTRFVALIPATFVAVLASHDYLAADRLDEWLNVVQSVQLPFALIPLLTLCGDPSIMSDEFMLSSKERTLGWTLGVVVMLIDVFLLGDKVQGSSFGILATFSLASLGYFAFLFQFTPYSLELHRRKLMSTSASPMVTERSRLVYRNGHEEFTSPPLYL